MNKQIRDSFEKVVSQCLTADDDLTFWLVAFDTLISDIEALYPPVNRKQEIFLQIGACSHWLRPHQTRWTAAGGFAWPEGYVQRYQDHVKGSWGPIGGGLPEFEWYVLVHWNRTEKQWEMVDPKFFGRKKLVFRVALPTRTARHLQAAIHAIWTPGTPQQPDKKVVQFYGFRKRNREWECVATRIV